MMETLSQEIGKQDFQKPMEEGFGCTRLASDTNTAALQTATAAQPWRKAAEELGQLAWPGCLPPEPGQRLLPL